MPRFTPEQAWIVRAALAIGGLLVLAFRTIHLFGDPAAQDPWAERVLLAAVCFGGALASLLPGFVNRLSTILVVVAFAATAWSLHNCWMNRFSPQTVIGLLTVLACSSAGMPTRRHLAWFLGATMLGCLATFIASPWPLMSGWFVMPHLLTIAGFAYLMAGSRLRTEEVLAQSEHLRRFMLDQTSDAIVILDPISRRAVEHNRRARELFELGLTPDPLVAAGAPFGERELSAIDSVMMLKETSSGPGIRRVQAYVTPSGRSFRGELVASQVRYGAKIMLLVRVSDLSEPAR